MDEVPWTALLAVAGEGGARGAHPFRHPRMTVGRKGQNDLALADEAVSAHHCEFVAEGRWLVVRDLGSANGTYVNDRRVREARLHDGDVVRVGGTRIGVQLQGIARADRRRRGIGRWLTGAALLLAAVGAALWLWRRAAEETDLRDRHAAAVREQLEAPPCVAAAQALAAARGIEDRLAGRSVAVAVGRARLGAAQRDANEELLALYRKRAELFDAAAAAVIRHQQALREGVERVSREGARLRAGRDRKAAAWIQAQLAERVARGDDYAQGLRGLAAETRRFAARVEQAARGGPDAQAAAQELSGFRFGDGVPGLQRACESEISRLDSSIRASLETLDPD